MHSEHFQLNEQALFIQRKIDSNRQDLITSSIVLLVNGKKLFTSIWNLLCMYDDHKATLVNNFILKISSPNLKNIFITQIEWFRRHIIRGKQMRTAMGQPEKMKKKIYALSSRHHYLLAAFWLQMCETKNEKKCGITFVRVFFYSFHKSNNERVAKFCK